MALRNDDPASGNGSQAILSVLSLTLQVLVLDNLFSFSLVILEYRRSLGIIGVEVMGLLALLAVIIWILQAAWVLELGMFDAFLIFVLPI